MEKQRKKIIVDCSIIIAAILEDEESSIANFVLNKLTLAEWEAVVPAIFFLEVANVLLNSFRKKRITYEIWQEYCETLSILPIEIDYESANASHLSELSILAKSFGLTTYDASYLELAKRLNVQLITLDEKLLTAAKLHHVALSKHYDK